MDFNFQKKFLCVLLSGIFLLTSLKTSCVMAEDESVVTALTEESAEIIDINTTYDGDVVIELDAQRVVQDTDKSQTCVKACSDKIVKIFDTANVLMKIIGSMTVYGGTAKIISDTFCENKVLYFVCAGVIIGVVEPIVKKVYNIAKENGKDVVT